MLAGLEQTARSVRWSVSVCALAFVSAMSLLVVPSARAQSGGRRTAGDDRQFEQTQREEGDAILALADAAMAGKTPSDFRVRWQNDFVKAQRGTFVPFTLTIDASQLSRRAALVYVRATRRSMLSAIDKPARSNAASRSGRGDADRDRAAEEAEYPVDAIFPVELPAGEMPRISRGFSVSPGEYDVFVVMRERVDPASPRVRPKASVLRQPLSVPEFRTGELTTSSVMLADRLTVLTEPVPADRLAERPYAIGRNEITPAADRRFGRNEELIVVFLVYNPMVTAERQFDVRVEYHFFRKGAAPGAPPSGAGTGPHPPGRAGEEYFNRTDPQRFNPALMGAAYDPATGDPVMAGQVVPLAGFEVGEYRLDVQITDLLSGKSISRDVVFTVGS
jgi:hypothetical protein